MLRLISIICACLCGYVVMGTAGASDFDLFMTAEFTITDIIQNFLIAIILFCIAYIAEFMHRALKK